MENILAEARRILGNNPNGKELAVVIEMYQKYIEYLDELETAPITIDTTVTVKVDGKTIRFNNEEDMSSWITSLL